MSHRRRVVNRRPACRLFATRTLLVCHMGCEQPLGRTARLRRWLAGRAAVCNPPPVSNSRRAILNGQKSSRNRAISLAIYGLISRLRHGVLIWLTASFLFQPDVLLKRPCPASLGVRERVPCPHSRPASAREARLPWREDPSGHPASMAGRASGHAEAAGRRMARALRHCRPPFVMTRNSFEGCRARSRLTSVTVLPGCRAHIHIPNDRATIIADITFRSHRRVKASSW